MSFILDALRKSEGERQRDAVPRLSQVPLAVPRTGLPRWVWLVIGALCLSVAVLAAAWWQGMQLPGTATPAQMVTNNGAETDVSTRVPSTTSSQTGLPPADPNSANFAPARIGPPASDPFDPIRTLPSIAEMRATGIALPLLELQLISFSEDASARFVFINGFQYRQGQRVQNGPQIISIYPAGIVLRQEGRDFVLLPN